MGAEEGAHEVEAAEEVRVPVGLERHDAVEGDDRGDQGVEDDVERRESPDPQVLTGGAGRRFVEAGGPLIIHGPAGILELAADGGHVGDQIGVDQQPPHREQHSEPEHHPPRHEPVGEPERLARRERGQLLLEAAVDRGVAQREHQDRPGERDRAEEHRRLGEAKDHAGPPGVGGLVDRREGEAPGGEPGEEQPVDMERLPGALAVAAGDGNEEQRGACEGKQAAELDEQVVASAHGAGNQALPQVAVGHGLAPDTGDATGAASCCSLRT